MAHAAGGNKLSVVLLSWARLCRPNASATDPVGTNSLISCAYCSFHFSSTAWISDYAFFRIDLVAKS